MTQLPIANPRVSKDDPPDADTQKAPDWTGDEAENRVLFIQLGDFFKLGTPEPGRAMAFLLCILILFITLVVMLAGLYSPSTIWLDRIFTWLGNAFLFLAGFAIGEGKRKVPGSKKPTHL